MRSTSASAALILALAFAPLLAAAQATKPSPEPEADLRRFVRSIEKTFSTPPREKAERPVRGKFRIVVEGASGIG